MINLSIMPLNADHIEEYCADIIEQQKSGATTHAMFEMKFQPEYTPPINKAEKQCKIYDIYREKLDKVGAKHGVLVQATLGHILNPREMYPYTPATSLIDGEPMISTCCPLDKGFREYIKNQMRILAEHNPSIVMIDDDCGLLYRKTKGCACKAHMEEFNRRAGTNMTREELYAHTQGKSEEDKRYTDIYVELQRDSLVGAVEAMRAGIDEVNPSIQGIVSSIYTSTFCEFSGDVAKAFAGKGNPVMIRYNGGPYAKLGTKFFTKEIFRAAMVREHTKDQVDICLAETDTCPQNRYSTAASMLHGHYSAIILEGAVGAKHWITRLGDRFELDSGKAYRKILSKYSKFYDKLSEYAKELSPFGCRIPLTKMQNYGFVPSEQGLNRAPWALCVLERMGLPLFFSNDDNGAVFMDDFLVDGFTDDEFRKFFSGTLILSAGAAEKLNKRGFCDCTGVDIQEWGNVVVTGELINNNISTTQFEMKKLVITSDNVKVLSNNVIADPSTSQYSKYIDVAPAVVSYQNPLGGETIVFCGTPDTPFTYNAAFSMLNETRKKQFIEILSKGNHIPLYYPEDSEIYLRAGYLKNGEIMAVFFNLSLDQHEDIPFVCTKEVSNVEILNPDGTRSKCNFKCVDGIVRVDKPLNTMIPAVLFIS